jgi:hypothetical protein
VTPEKRFERIEKILDRMAADSKVSTNNIEAKLELLADFMSKSTEAFEQRMKIFQQQMEVFNERFDEVEKQLRRVVLAIRDLARLVAPIRATDTAAEGER